MKFFRILFKEYDGMKVGELLVVVVVVFVILVADVIVVREI